MMKMTLAQEVRAEVSNRNYELATDEDGYCDHEEADYYNDQDLPAFDSHIDIMEVYVSEALRFTA